MILSLFETLKQHRPQHYAQTVAIFVVSNEIESFDAEQTWSVHKTTAECSEHDMQLEDVSELGGKTSTECTESYR